MRELYCGRPDPASSPARNTKWSVVSFSQDQCGELLIFFIAWTISREIALAVFQVN
jgi:hypothetical protein